MNEKYLSISVRLICIGGIAAGLHLDAAAQAQTAEEAPITTVQVTGSRIASPNAESPSPLQVFTAADIAASGVTNVQELLLRNPTMGSPTYARTNTSFATASVGVATVDLRNLGVARTLVLINGRRVVAGVPGDSAVDLNTIPVDFIERVELLTGGASATYGSDAVAGVVNIILKKNFEGVAIDAQVGRSQEGDDSKKKLSLTFGTTSADGQSNIMGHLGYSKQGAVMSRDRPATALDQNSLMIETGLAQDAFTPVRPFFSSFAPQGRFFHDTGSYTYDRAGNVIPWSTNGGEGVAATGFNRSEFRTIAVPAERYLFAASGNHAFNANHSAFFEGNYAATRAATTIEPFALGAEDIYPASGGQVPAEFMSGGALLRNPLVPQYLFDRISDTDGDGLADYYFTRRMAEVGTRGSVAERDTFRLATGLKGTLRNWNYETYVVYGKTKEAQTSTGQVNVLNFRNALEAIPDLDDVNGNGNTAEAICRDANARAQNCVPINVFGFNTISPAALQYVTAPGSLITSTTQKLVGGSVNGEVAQLPAGPLGVAAGFEWRQEESSSVPDPLTQAGLNAGNATPPTFGKFKVSEFFVESRVPILKDQPFARNLNFLGAVRRGDYSTVGNTTSWNAGLEWSPVSDIKFRATRALSTRAPNINELFQPPSQDFPSGLVDPCAGISASTPGARADACRAAPGVAANIAANGVFTLNQADQQGISGYNRGNPSLEEEEGRSTTIGLVYTPRSIPMLRRLTLTADYFNIKIAGAIVQTPRQYALESCYGGGNPVFCSFITRRPAQVGANSAGSLEFIDTAVSNSGGTATEGIDLTAAWADRLGPGRLNVYAAYTHVRKGYDVPTPGAEQDPWAGEVNYAKNRASLNLGYKWGPWGISGATTFIGSSSLDDQFLKQFELGAGSVKVGSRTYQDFQMTYALQKQVELYAGIDNAFDRSAPPIISGLAGSETGTETASGTYDPIGRRYYLGVRVGL